MHIIDLKTLTLDLKTTKNIPLYSSIIILNHLTYSPLTYVKLEINILVLEIMNHEEDIWMKRKATIHPSIRKLETSLLYIKMNLNYIP